MIPGLNKIIHRIFEDLKTGGCTVGNLFHAPLGHLTDTGPIGMVGPMVETFRVRHETEDPSGRIANTGDVHDRTIGIGRKGPLGKLSIR